MRIGVVEWDVEIVVLLDCPFFLLQLKDLVPVRATTGVSVRTQKDEFTLVCCLKMWTVDEHGEMGGVFG